MTVGPCALDYSRMKTVDHLWTDPPADELVQRHKISSGHLNGPATPPQTRRPGLHVSKSNPTYVVCCIIKLSLVVAYNVQKSIVEKLQLEEVRM